MTLAAACRRKGNIVEAAPDSWGLGSDGCCPAVHRFGFVCTAAKGHEAAHAAYGTRSLVPVQVWEDKEE